MNCASPGLGHDEQKVLMIGVYSAWRFPECVRRLPLTKKTTTDGERRGSRIKVVSYIPIFLLGAGLFVRLRYLQFYFM